MEQNNRKKLFLLNSMRLAWEQHVYWTRMLLISLAAKLGDIHDVETRLLRNPGDIAAIFSNYYGPDIAKKINDLLTEHLQIGEKIIIALRDHTPADELIRQWYVNADKMAEAFNSINPNYKLEEMRKMLHTHLDLTTKEVTLRLAGKHKEDIAAFDEVELEALEMADYFSDGIMKQFTNRF